MRPSRRIAEGGGQISPDVLRIRLRRKEEVAILIVEKGGNYRFRMWRNEDVAVFECGERRTLQFSNAEKGGRFHFRLVK